MQYHALRLAVNEGEVDLAGQTLRQQSIERPQCRPDREFDACINADFLPVSPRDIRPLGTDIAAPEFAVRRQGFGDAQ